MVPLGLKFYEFRFWVESGVLYRSESSPKEWITAFNHEEAPCTLSGQLKQHLDAFSWEILFGFFPFLFIDHVIGSAYLELEKWHRFHIGLQFIISECLRLCMLGQCFIAFSGQEVTIPYPDSELAKKHQLNLYSLDFIHSSLDIKGFYGSYKALRRWVLKHRKGRLIKCKLGKTKSKLGRLGFI